MEVYPSICSGWVYVLKNLNKNPTFGHIDISKPRFVYPKKQRKIPLLNQPFAGEPHAACSQEPSWKPVVPKLESLAKKAQKRWRDLVQLNDAKMLGGHRTNGFIWFYVIFYLLPAIKFWKMYEAVISWYSQWVSNYLHVFLLYFSIHTYVFMLASPTCNSQFVLLSFMSEKQKLRIADRWQSDVSLALVQKTAVIHVPNARFARISQQNDETFLKGVRWIFSTATTLDG